MKYDLSILIPARNEQFLARTVRDILENKQGSTEIIVVLDGQWATPTIEQHPDVTVVYLPESIGQRAATNLAANISKSKYLMKVDAHCAFDKGFDVKMLADMQDDITMVPIMRNLHVFDWVCEDGHRRYQGTSGLCNECKKETKQDIVWIPKKSPQSKSYCFDSEPHFQYFAEFSKRPEGKGWLTPTMSLQGSCFLMTKERYTTLNMSDESWGSWGSQGIEVACKTWLSGGRVMVNQKTWYAHLFRTQGGDFSFPYPQSGSKVSKAKKIAREHIFGNKFPHQIHPTSWLLEKFWPVPGWSQTDLDKLKEAEFPAKEVTKGIIYYTDNRLDPKIMKTCQDKIMEAGLPIVSASLEPIDFGQNIVVPMKRGYLTMAEQILCALEKSTADVVFFCEHDVLYDKSHFDFVPPTTDRYYYNVNVWKLRLSDGFAVKVDDCRQLSGLCADRKLLVTHFQERVRRIRENGFSRKMGFEPGTHNRAERIDDVKSDIWQSENPIVDIRHDGNLTSSRWSKDQFRNQRYTKGWTEASEIPHWGIIKM